MLYHSANHSYWLWSWLPGSLNVQMNLWLPGLYFWYPESHAELKKNPLIHQITKNGLALFSLFSAMPKSKSVVRRPTVSRICTDNKILINILLTRQVSRLKEITHFSPCYYWNDTSFPMPRSFHGNDGDIALTLARLCGHDWLLKLGENQKWLSWAKKTCLQLRIVSLAMAKARTRPLCSQIVQNTSRLSRTNSISRGIRELFR